MLSLVHHASHRSPQFRKHLPFLHPLLLTPAQQPHRPHLLQLIPPLDRQTGRQKAPLKPPQNPQPRRLPRHGKPGNDTDALPPDGTQGMNDAAPPAPETALQAAPPPPTPTPPTAIGALASRTPQKPDRERGGETDGGIYRRGSESDSSGERGHSLSKRGSVQGKREPGEWDARDWWGEVENPPPHFHRPRPRLGERWAHQINIGGRRNRGGGGEAMAGDDVERGEAMAGAGAGAGAT